MQKVKEWWQALSRKWRLCIIIGLVVVGLVWVVVAGAAKVLEYAKENPSTCGKCHIMQPYVNSYYESNFIDNVHAKAEPDVKCKNCHQVTLMEQTKELISFVTGSYDTPLRQHVQAQGFCTGCHPATEITNSIRSMPKFAENPLLSYHLATAGGKNGCRDPRAELVQCQDCHKVHRTGVNYCAACHTSGFTAPNK